MVLIRKNWKRYLAVLLAVVMCFGLAACAPAKKEGGTSAGSASSGEVDALIWLSSYPQYADQMMKDFKAKYPDIKVNLTMMSGNSTSENIEPRIASGNMPDVCSVDIGEWYYTNADKGYFKDLGETKGWKEQRDVIKPQFTSPKGVKYGVAYGLAAMFMFYNKDMFKDAGITEMPKDYEEFLAVCEKLKGKGYTPLAFPGGFPNMIRHTYVSAGVANNIYAKDKGIVQKTLNTAYDYNTPEMIDIYQKIVDMKDKGYYNAGYMSTDNAEMIRLFSEKKVAMCWNGSWSAADFLPLGEHVDVFVTPWNAKGKPTIASVGGETGFGMGKKDKENKAAQTFFDFISYDNYAKFQNATGTIPTFEKMAGTKVDPRMQKGIDAIMKLEGAPLAFQMFPASVLTASDQLSQDILTGAKKASDVGSVFNPIQKEYIAARGK